MKARPFTALGVDVGGTKIAAGIVSFPEGSIREQKLLATEPARGGEAVLNDIVGLADHLHSAAHSLNLKIEAIGLGLCELVSPTGLILSENCISWKDQPVTARLSRLAPVTMEADVRAAALAEALFGAGRGRQIFLYVTVGTGISSCLMIHGEPFLGTRGATGTIASSPLGWLCDHCGQVLERTLEELASGPGLVRRFNQKRPGGAATGAEVAAAASSGDAEALEVLRSAGRALGSTLGLVVNMLDPEAIVIGGGLGLSQGAYWDTLVASTRAHIWSEVHRDLPIVRATTGSAAGLLGAAASAWKKSAVP